MARPPYSDLPADTRDLFLRYGCTRARKNECAAVALLMRRLGLSRVDQLETVTEEQVEEFLRRGRRPRRGLESATSDDGDRRLLVRSVRAIVTRAGLSVPGWVETVAPRPKHGRPEGRTTPRWWPQNDPWMREISAAIAQMSGQTQRGATGAIGAMLLLLSYCVEVEEERARRSGQARRCVLEALLDRKEVTVPALRRLIAGTKSYKKQRGRDATMSRNTLERRLDSCRALFRAYEVAASEEGSLCGACRAAIERSCTRNGELDLDELNEGFNRWNRKCLRAVRVLLAEPQPVRPPIGADVRKIAAHQYGRLAELKRAHEGRGQSLDDWASWQRWDPQLRTTLGSIWTLECMRTAAMRIGSVHGQQPKNMRHLPVELDRFRHAIEIGRVLVKNTTSGGANHGNNPYGEEAPNQQCSDWIVLGMPKTPYALDQVLEWYLHSVGQCLGSRNNCRASDQPVLREFEVRWNASLDRFEYWEIDARAGSRTLCMRTRNGEWLYELQASKGEATRFNPMWFDLMGRKPISLDPFTRRLVKSWAEIAHVNLHAHQWRHFAPFVLRDYWGMRSDKEVAQMCHMDVETLRRIYQNPTLYQMLEMLPAAASGAPAEPTDTEQVIAELQARVTLLSAELAERKADLDFLHPLLLRAFGLVPRRPVTAAAASTASPTKARRRREPRRPMGAAAIAA